MTRRLWNTFCSLHDLSWLAPTFGLYELYASMMISDSVTTCEYPCNSPFMNSFTPTHTRELMKSQAQTTTSSFQPLHITTHAPLINREDLHHSRTSLAAVLKRECVV
jgi:hypothetical protein